MSFVTLDHPSVQKVLQIVENLVHENKVITTRIIYNRAKHRLKIPRNGLLKIIQLLIDRKILVDGSRFTRDSVLLNKMRNFVYEIIISDLGIHFSEIKRKIDSVSEVSTGQLIWHIEMLLKFAMIKKVKFKNYTIFLPIDIEDRIGVMHFLLRDKTNFNILELLSKKGPIEKSSLYESLKEEREKVYYHLKTLQDNDIIMLKEDFIHIVPEMGLTLKKLFKNMYIQKRKEDH